MPVNRDVLQDENRDGNIQIGVVLHVGAVSKREKEGCCNDGSGKNFITLKYKPTYVFALFDCFDLIILHSSFILCGSPRASYGGAMILYSS